MSLLDRPPLALLSRFVRWLFGRGADVTVSSPRMEPHPNVLSRDVTEKKPALDVFGGLLEEAVNFGTHLFTWSVETKPVEPPNLVIGALLHQFVETMDGAEVLVRQGATEPMKLVLRSALESFLGLLYILDRDTELRALCYRVADFRRRIKILRQHDPATPQGQAFLAEIAKDTTGLATIGAASSRDTSADVAKLEAALDSENDMRKVHADWKAMRKANGWDPPWYALMGGPGNLCDLAAGLGFSGWYRILYAGWSATMHAEDALTRVEIHVQNKEGRVRAMRHPEDLQVLTSIGASMAVKLYEKIVSTRVQSHRSEFADWYTRIREPYRRVADPEPMIRFRTAPVAEKK